MTNYTFTPGGELGPEVSRLREEMNRLQGELDSAVEAKLVAEAERDAVKARLARVEEALKDLKSNAWVLVLNRPVQTYCDAYIAGIDYCRKGVAEIARKALERK